MQLPSKVAVGVAVLLMSCEEPSRPPPRVLDASPGPKASASASATPAPGEGCVRAGSMEAASRDPSCIVAHAAVEAVRASARQLALRASVDRPEVLAGSAAVVRVTIENTGSTETTVFLEANRRRPGPRIDWSRVAGVPAPAVTPEAPRLFFPMTTLDAKERDVDSPPTLPSSVEAEPPSPRILAVRLRPGGKLTHDMSWWAYRIPAPPPIVKDDAGRHRYIPKTSAVHLAPGEYTILVDLPLYGLSPEERRVSTSIRVLRGFLPDGGIRR